MISAWLSAHLQAAERALKRLVATPVATMLSVLVIGVAIMLPLGLYSVFSNITAAASRLNTEPNINVYMQVSATDKDAKDIEKQLKVMPNAADVRFISREVALSEMKRVASMSDLLVGLESNPLPHAFLIKPKSAEPVTLETMRKEIAALPKVDAVVMDFEWAKKLQRFATFAERIVALLGLLLGLAVVFVTGNTIRLQILTQKDEIEVSSLIGATRHFIRRPFLYYGAFQGFLAGVVAVLAMIGLIWWASAEVQALTISYGSDFSIKYFSLNQILFVIGVGAALGWLGGFMSVSLYLRAHTRR